MWDVPTTPVQVGGSNNKVQNQPAAAVAYESMSGDALLVYGNDDINDVRYRTRNNGTNTWSNETIISSLSLSSDRNVERAILRADPDSNSDNVVLGVVDGDVKGWAAIWNGTSWQNQIQLPNDDGNNKLTGNAYPSMALAFEGEQSGNALVVYGDGSSKTKVWSQRWNKTTSMWADTGQSIVTPGGGDTLAMALTPNPTTNNIMVLVQDNDDGLHAWLWDGPDIFTFNRYSLE